jgi:hypothetical protein
MATVATNGRTNRRPRVVAADELAAQPVGLAQALLAFAAEAPKLIRDQPGQIGSRSYTYTSLDALLDDVAPLLLKHDLLWTAKVTTEDGQPAALYRMEHVPSGEHDEWTGPLPCVDPGPQNLGSAITYMRRYTLQAYLNLAPGEDDDGAAASQSIVIGQPVDRYAQAETAHAQLDINSNSVQPTAAAPRPSERAVTANQREKLLRPRARKAGLSAGQFANVILAAKGEAPRQWSSAEHAAQTLDRELDRLPARLKDAVLEGIAAAGGKS